MPMTEEEVRLVARVTAEEMSRVLRSSFRSGHEAELGEDLPFDVIDTIDTTDASEHEVCRQVRTFSVVDTGGCIGELVLYGRSGKSKRIPFAAGTHFDDLPIERVVLDVQTAGTRNALFLASSLPRAFRPPPLCCEAIAGTEIVTVSAPSPLSGAAVAGNVASTLQGAQGYRYELIDLCLEFDADATAANRLAVIDLYDDDGTTIRQTVGSDLVQANQLGHVAGGPASAPVLNLETGRLTQAFFLSQDVVLSTGVNLARVTIAAGVAGDAYKVAARYRRTPA